MGEERGDAQGRHARKRMQAGLHGASSGSVEMSVKVTQPFWLLLLIERITAARFDAHAEIVGSTTSGRALRLMNVS